MNASVRQILLHFDPTRAAGRRLELACAIAKELGASLAALYAATPGLLELPYAPEIGPSLAAELVEIDEERLTAARAAFERVMAPLHADARARWAELDQWPIGAAFALQALHADLLVLGQRDPEDPASGVVPEDFVESVLVASGRPAIVVPYAAKAGKAATAPRFERIAVAWKETREAARALSAAIPFMQRAREVHVMRWGEGDEHEVLGSRLDLDGYLAAHGVQATWHRESNEPGSIGDILLSRADDLGADLLVMGCYGHSRAREWVLGGASRTVLRSMTVPVLMAH